jgi:hypothetical protein
LLSFLFLIYSHSASLLYLQPFSILFLLSPQFPFLFVFVYNIIILFSSIILHYNILFLVSGFLFMLQFVWNLYDREHQPSKHASGVAVHSRIYRMFGSSALLVPYIAVRHAAEWCSHSREPVDRYAVR